MSYLLAAISLGFLGSFHCIGMCGPISLALPVHKFSSVKKTLLILLYNLGRMSTYAIFGAVVGGLGHGIVIAGYQGALSISLGAFILAGLIFPRLFSANGKVGQLVYPIFSKLRNLLAGLLKKDAASSLFTVGLLNGILPCGLVYMGLAGATATGSVFDGALFMFVFGAGTVPIMVSLPLAGSFITVDARNKIRKTVPIVVGLTAILLVVRGLELGIPYVSPAAPVASSSTMNCHNLSEQAQHNAITCTGQNSAPAK